VRLLHFVLSSQYYFEINFYYFLEHLSKISKKKNKPIIAKIYVMMMSNNKMYSTRKRRRRKEKANLI
jgi:hypothetical protein